jgi:DNA-binding beta-propeller fold protein YncE
MARGVGRWGGRGADGYRGDRSANVLAGGAMTRRCSGRWTRSLISALAVLAMSCNANLPLEGRSCPCAEGWTCCALTDRCVRTVAECPDLKQLTLLIGRPGGRGTADGVGSEARFSNPMEIVGGDSGILYVADCPLGAGSESEPYFEDAPCGIRRITNWSPYAGGEVSWLVSDLEVQPQFLTMAGGMLYAAASAYVAGGKVLQIHPETGAVTTVLATGNAVLGIAADRQSGLYVISDPHALQRLNLATGQVTEVVAMPEDTWLDAVVVHHGHVFFKGCVVENYSCKARYVWRYDPSDGSLEDFWVTTWWPIPRLFSCRGELVAKVDGCFRAFDSNQSKFLDKCTHPFDTELFERFGDQGRLWCTDGGDDGNRDSWFVTESNATVRALHREYWAVGESVVAGEPAHASGSSSPSPSMDLAQPSTVESDGTGGLVFQSANGVVHVQGMGNVSTGSWRDAAGPRFRCGCSGSRCGILRCDTTREAYCDGEVVIDRSRGCQDVTVETADRLFVAEPDRIVRIELANGKETTLPAPEGGWAPTAVAYDPRGVLYVAEAKRQRVLAHVPTTGRTVELVGKSGHRGVQLGPLPASLNYPIDLAVLVNGELAIADYYENVILLVR